MLAVGDADWHTSDRLEVPPGIHLAFLPPASPELQPAERLWPPLDDQIASGAFATLGELEDALAEHCRVLEADRPAPPLLPRVA